MSTFTAITLSIITIGGIIIASSLIALAMFQSEVEDEWDKFLEEFLKEKDGEETDDTK